MFLFQNYIMTFVRNYQDRWRIRFRKNPGFQLLAEQYPDLPVELGRSRRMAHVFEADDTMRLVMNGQELLNTRETEIDSLNRTGYHGIRSWDSKLIYFDFRV